MKHDFLIGAVQLNQAFESQESGGPSSGITRRSFIKRTGGAAAATIIAWNTQAFAIVKDDSASVQGSKKNWKIMVEEVNFNDDSSGSNKTWDDDGNPETEPIDVRKTLNLRITAPATTFAGSATSALTVTVQEWADYKPNPTTEPDVWQAMDEDRFNRYRGQSKDVHTMSASMKKSIDSDSGSVTTDDYSPQSNYDETKNNISLNVTWEGDKLKVTWGASDVANETKSTELVFHKKAFSISR